MAGPEVDLTQAPRHSTEWCKVLAELEAHKIVSEKREEEKRELEKSLEPSDE